MFLPMYKFSKHNADWTYRLESENVYISSLTDFDKGTLPTTIEPCDEVDYDSLLTQAESLVEQNIKQVNSIYGKQSVDHTSVITEDF